MRPAQIGWIERRLDQGGRTFVAVRRARSELWLYPKAIRALASERLDVVPGLGHWEGGPAKWDWAEVARLLQSRREDSPNQRIPGKLQEASPRLSEAIEFTDLIRAARQSKQSKRRRGVSYQAAECSADETNIRAR